MAPIRLEIGGKTFNAKDNEKNGISFRTTDLGIIYAGTEQGGYVVVTRRNSEHKYEHKEPIIVQKGEKPVIKDIEYRSNNGQKKIITAKITGI